MHRHSIQSQPWMVRTALLLLFVPVLGLAQSPHQGIYIGTYQAAQDNGEFALIVNEQGLGILGAYDVIDDRGYLENNIRVKSDGSFLFFTRHGVRINGQVTASGISGRYLADGVEGSFSGLRMVSDGPLQNASGYYSGSVTITGTGPGADRVINSRMVAIIAADGNAFFMLDPSFPRPAGFWPGDFDFYSGNAGFGPGDFDFYSGHTGFWPGGLSFDLDLGFGIDLDFDFEYDRPFHQNSGFCRPFHFGRGFGGWPFNFGLDYSIRLSFLGFIDLDFDFDYNLPSCGSDWRWNHFPAPVENSGGIVLIGPDGIIEDSLMDGMVLRGYFDPMIGNLEGTLFQTEGATDWVGSWVIERQFNTSGVYMAEHYNRLPDINEDGYTDILWQHAVTGEIAVWLMDGAEIVAELPLENQWDPKRALADEIHLIAESSGQFELSGVGDFNGDGSSDILWHDPESGDVIVTTRPGEEGAEDTLLGANVAEEWLLGGIGDLDGDGTDDLIWRHSQTGENITWFIIDAQVVESASLMAVPDLHWRIQH